MQINFFNKKRIISEKQKPFIIGEISANHDNSLDKTFELLKLAKKIGLESVKFQTFDLDEMTLNIEKKEFMLKNSFKSSSWNDRSLYSLYQEAQLPHKWHEPLFKFCKSLKLLCFSSVFDKISLKLLEKLNCPIYKIASLESLHFPLIEKVLKTRKPVFISTGTLNIEEIDELVCFLKKKSNNYLLMHCVTDYPANIQDLNLAHIKYLKSKYKCEVGFSDHTIGNIGAIASIAHGATVIEKHFKLKEKKNMLDNNFSLNPSQMMKFINDVNNSWIAIGKSPKQISVNEKKFVKYRRSIYATNDIQPNEIFTVNNVKIIRPGLGLSPKYYNDLLGKNANKFIRLGTPIDLKDFNYKKK